MIDKKRQRVSIGEKEKNFIAGAYNKSSGKEWKDVLRYVRERIVDQGLPHHVVNLYLTQNDERLTSRMRRIIQETLRQATSSSCTSESTSQDASAPLINNTMKYAKKQTPEERKREALKRKLDAEFIDGSHSSHSSDEDKPSGSKKKTTVQDAHAAHTKMCEKALKTMDNVNDLLSKVDKYLQKNN